MPPTSRPLGAESLLCALLLLTRRGADACTGPASCPRVSSSQPWGPKSNSGQFFSSPHAWVPLQIWDVFCPCKHLNLGDSKGRQGKQRLLSARSCGERLLGTDPLPPHPGSGSPAQSFSDRPQNPLLNMRLYWKQFHSMRVCLGGGERKRGAGICSNSTVAAYRSRPLRRPRRFPNLDGEPSFLPATDGNGHLPSFRVGATVSV